jgi:hypothetical protein
MLMWHAHASHLLQIRCHAVVQQPPSLSLIGSSELLRAPHSSSVLHSHPIVLNMLSKP